MKRFLRMLMMCMAGGTLMMAPSCTDAEKVEDGGVLRVKLAVDASAVTRAEQMTVAAPEAAAFDLEVATAEGEQVEYWASLEELTADRRFEVGEYQLKATYGDVTDEGFDKTAFEAQAPCRIMPNQTTLVNMTATLVNTGVRVSRSAAFAKYFSNVTVELESAAGAVIPFVEDEQRVAFVAPEGFALKVAYTKPNGTEGNRTFRVSDVQPRTIYNVRLDVNDGEVGSAALVVKFDDSVTVENVEIEIDEQ
ncbi:MAG: DUF4493 domain-containing protein [Rikenellaceae bacterium]|nr:DUF4493 domain-containing protein [Rikenellaceae bacterium]